MLTKDRNTPHREGVFTQEPLTAGVQVHAGGLVVSDSATGYSKAGATGLGLVARGVAQESATGGDNDGDVSVKVRRGAHQFKNSAGGDEITRAHLELTAYIVDDETVASTDGAGTRSAAGKIIDVDADGVWIDI